MAFLVQATIEAHGQPVLARAQVDIACALRLSPLSPHYRPMLTVLLSLQVQDKLEKLSGGGSPVSAVATPRSSFERRSLSSARAHDSKPRADEQYEILCNDVVLPLDMTLAAVRQYVWRRQSAELVMHYRRKHHALPTAHAQDAA